MKIMQRILVTLVCVLPLSNIAYGQADFPEEVRQQTQKRIDLGYHLGTVIGVIDKNGTRFYSFGQMSLSDKTMPDENSIFEIASITKTFTAGLLANLELNNEMSIQDPIIQYIPAFKNVWSAPNSPMLLLDLVNHTSGLPRNPTNTDNEDGNRYENYSVSDLNAFLSTFSLDKKPTTRQYTNTGSLVLEHAIEGNMGKSYEHLINDRLINVLGMKDTYFTVPENKRNRLVTGFRRGVETREVNVGQWNAMGGIKSTAKDMISYIGAQLGLTQSSLTDALQMTHKEYFRDEENIEALGWHIKVNEPSGKNIHYHSGGTDGFVSFAAFSLEDQVGVVVLINGTNLFSDLGFHIIDPTYPLKTVEERAY